MTELWSRVLRRYRFKLGLVRPRVPLVFRRTAPVAPHTIHRTTVAHVSAPVSIHVRLAWPHWLPSPVRPRQPESPAEGSKMIATAVRLESRTYVSTRVLVERTPLGPRSPLRSPGHGRSGIERAAAARTMADRSQAMRDALASGALATRPNRPPLSVSLRPVVERRLASAVAEPPPSVPRSARAEAPRQHPRAATETTMVTRRARHVGGVVTPVTARRMVAATSLRIRPAVRVAAQPPAVQRAQAVEQATATDRTFVSSAIGRGFHGEPVMRTFAVPPVPPASQPDTAGRPESARREVARSQGQTAAS
jgi:hypothetical protein